MEAAMGSMSVIIGACAIRARYRNKKIPTFIRGADDGKQNEGAYVGEHTPVLVWPNDLWDIE
jgi:hypothetical protein